MIPFLSRHKLDIYLLNLCRYDMNKLSKFIEDYGDDAAEAAKDYPDVMELLT